MFPERYYSTYFMEDLFLDQSSEVTCSSLHSLVGPELSLLTPSCGLFLSFASHVCDTDFDAWNTSVLNSESFPFSLYFSVSEHPIHLC